MKYLLVRHGPPRSPYNFETGLAASGSTTETVLFSEGERPSFPEGFDAVVVFGGYMYATEDDRHPWIPDELRYMESVMKAGVPLLGICLGGQLLARLLGARVYRTPVPEFGYWEIERTEAGRASPLFADLPEPLLGFLWHNDAFDLPEGASRLARTEHCPNQAFSYGDRTFGLQFHLEFSADQLRSMVTKDSASLPPPSAVWQDPSAVAANEAAHASVRSSMLRILETMGRLKGLIPDAAGLENGRGCGYRSGMQRITVPLLHDNHNHASLYAALSSCPDLSGLKADKARSLLESLPADRLSVVRGWRTNELPLGPEDLRLLPPVLLVNFSLHGFAVSDKGLPYLEASAPELAVRRNDPGWLESHVPAIFAAYCDLAGVSPEKFEAGLAALESLGTGSSDDLTTPTIEALDVSRNPAFARRVVNWAAPELFDRLDPARRKACAGIKLFMDGAFGARSAAIAGPWIGPGAAFLAYGDEALAEALGRIAGWGAAAAVHAIGEIAIEQLLRILEARLSRGPSLPLVRLEHAQMISREQAFRARDLGIVLSMQPNFSGDSRDYSDRLPRRYLEANNPFRMLIDEAGFEPGKDLLFGSDGMPSGIACAAVESLFPVVPGQRLAVEELVAGYGPARGVSGNAILEIDENARRVTLAGVER